MFSATRTWSVMSAPLLALVLACSAGGGDDGKDTEAPDVGPLTKPAEIRVFEPATFSAPYVDNQGVIGCDIWVGNSPNDGELITSMDLVERGAARGTATVSLIVSEPFTVPMFASCEDAAGNEGYGDPVEVTVLPAL